METLGTQVKQNKTKIRKKNTNRKLKKDEQHGLNQKPGLTRNTM